MKSVSYLPVWLLLLLLNLVLGGANAAAVTNSLRESTYKQLVKVHSLMERGDHENAIRRLDVLNPRVQHNTYEHAVVLQTYGYLYVELERYAKAIKVIQQSLSLKSLPVDTTRNLLYLSAQLRVSTGDDKGAIADLTQWFAGEKDPQLEPHMLAGLAHSRLQDYPSAIKHLELVVNANAQPQETAMRRLLVVYLKVEDYVRAARLLQEIVTLQPQRVDDWRQLAAIYRELGQERKALAVLGIAYRKGLLQSENDLMALVDYHLYLETPREAAKLLSSLLDKGLVASNLANWEKLAGAWFQSKEMPKAIHALSQGALLTDDPQFHLKRARLAAAGEDWSEVLKAATDVLQSNSMNRSGEALVLAGIAHYQRGEAGSAREAFTRALEDKKSHSEARQWLDYLTQQGD